LFREKVFAMMKRRERVGALLACALSKCGVQMKIIAFILEQEEVIHTLRHLALWPIEYPKSQPVDARASPFDFKLLRKLSESSNLK
jgi:hypothetical protein